MTLTPAMGPWFMPIPSFFRFAPGGSYSMHQPWLTMMDCPVSALVFDAAK